MYLFNAAKLNFRHRVAKSEEKKDNLVVSARVPAAF